MSLIRGVTRRDLFMKAGIFLNGIVGVILAVPIVRYLLSPVTRERKAGYDSWIPLGKLEQFPSGETRLALQARIVRRQARSIIRVAQLACSLHMRPGDST